MSFGRANTLKNSPYICGISLRGLANYRRIGFFTINLVSAKTDLKDRQNVEFIITNSSFISIHRCQNEQETRPESENQTNDLGSVT